ncbi:MAG: CARDB domain-containing protein, partial [Myxococcales bacterium]
MRVAGGCIAVAAGAVLAAGAASAQTPSQKGSTWLLAQQGADGSFGGATGNEPLLTTIEAVQALTPLTGASSSPLESALAYVHAQAPAELDLTARRLQLLQGTLLADPLAAKLLEAALQPQAVLDGVQLGPAFTGAGFLATDAQASALDTARALAFLAKRAEAQPPPITLGQSASLCGASSAICSVATPLLQTLLALQHADGGWGYADGDSDPRLTAEVLAVVMPLAAQLTLSGPLSGAASYLLSQQASDGHFGNAQPSTSDTAVAVLGLVGAPVSTESAVTQAVAEFGASQAADGSWDESELDTALALRAIQASLPNLQVAPGTSGLDSSLTLSNQQPQQGSTVTASVTIPNSGATASASTTVAFVATCGGNPPVTLGTATVPSIAAGGQTTVTATLDTSGLAGGCQITAVLNPTNQIENATSTNQTTSTPIQVVTSEDLSIEPTDIQFAAADGGLVQISVTVHENGVAESSPFQVAVYQGDPAAGGSQIGTASVASIPASGSATVTVDWNPSTANGPTPIYAIADPQEAVPDSNRVNNEASRYYGATAGSTDLAVISSGVVFTPSILHPNVPETVHVYVQNLSAVDAYGVQVELCQVQQFGEHCTPGTAYDTTLPLVSGNDGFATATFAIPGSAITLAPQATSGQLIFSVTVDPLGLLSDPNRNNNQVQVSAAVSLNAALTAQLQAICGFDATGHVTGSVTLVPSFVATGAAGPLDVPYAIYLGEPELGGQQIASGDLPPAEPPQLEILAPPIAFPLWVLVLDPENTLHNLTPYLSRASASCSPARLGDYSNVVMSYEDVAYSPVGPAVGETTQVTATIHNQGPVTSTGVLRVYAGNPTTPAGQELVEFPFSLGAGSNQTWSFPWMRAGEETNLFFGIMDLVPENLLGTYGPSQTEFYTYRNSFLEAVYTSGRTSTFYYDDGLGPQTSPPTIGDLLKTGQPVIGYGEALNGFGDGGAFDEEYYGSLTLLQKLPDNSVQTLWTERVDNAVGQPVFVDLGIDAGPQVVFLSNVGPYLNSFATGQPGQHAFRGNTIHVWNPDGTVAWERSYVLGPDGGPVDACMNESNLVAPGIGDVNGDGVVDIVFPTADGTLHVLDGRTGNPVWEAALPAGTSCLTYEADPAGWAPQVLDLFGDAGRTVVLQVAPSIDASNPGEGNVALYSSAGQDLTPGGGVFPVAFGAASSTGNVAVTDLAGPGAVPTMVTSTATGWGQAASPAGQVLWQYNGQDQIFHGPFAVADGTACGSPLLFWGSFAGPLAMRGTGTPLWIGDPQGIDGYPTGDQPPIPRAVAAADLLGLGTPQYLGVANENALFILDGRTGADLLKTHVFIADYGNGDDEGEFSDLAIADVDGDGHGEVVVNVQPDGSDYGPSPGYESHASLYVFGSDAHWKPMANVWSGNQYHHQFNPDLTLTADAYAP